MKKRLRKKIHKLYLIEVVYAVSVSSIWRKMMFQSVRGKRHYINKINSNRIDKPLKSIINRYNLRYSVSIIPYEEAVREWDDLGSSQAYFKFESVEFPNLVDYSADRKSVV